MKKMTFVSLFADIRRSLTLCACISIIVMLGVLFYTGIAFTVQGMNDTLDKYYADSRYRDLQILSPEGFTNADIARLEELAEIGEAEGAFSFDAYLDLEQQKRVVSVRTLTEKVDVAELLEGRLPEGEYECAIDELLLDEGVRIGDELPLEFAQTPLSAALGAEKWTVTGVIRHPECCTKVPDRRGISSLGSGAVQNYLFIDISSVQAFAGEDSYSILLASFDRPISVYSQQMEDVCARVRAEVEELEPDWLIFDKRDALSYVVLNISAENLSNTGFAFSWMFIGLAVIVCYTSFNRLINERRSVIGMQKALGYRTGELVRYYLLYAFLCALPGALAGAAGGYWIAQPILLPSYLKNYLISDLQNAFIFSDAALAVLAFIAVILISAAVPVLGMLRRPAIELMRPGRNDGARLLPLRRALGQNRVSVRKTVALLNLISDPTRLFATVISVSGCAALILTGLSLKFGLQKIPDIQYGQIMKFDRILTIENGSEPEMWREFLSEHGIENTAEISSTACTFETGSSVNSAMMVITEDESITDFFALLDPYTGAALELPEEGALFSVRTCEYFGLSVGDMITLTQADGSAFDVKLVGIVDYYIDHMIVMNTGYYESVSGKKAETNSFYINLGGEKDIPSSELSEQPGYVRYISADYKRSNFDAFADSMNMIVSVMIAFSAMLAVVVLYQMHKLTMDKKTGELAIMYANGFTKKELRRYITNEDNVLTVVGMLLGIALGALLTGYMFDTLETDTVKVYRQLSPLVCIVSAGLTGLFAALIEYFLLRRLDPRTSFLQRMRQRNE